MTLIILDRLIDLCILLNPVLEILQRIFRVHPLIVVVVEPHKAQEPPDECGALESPGGLGVACCGRWHRHTMRTTQRLDACADSVFSAHYTRDPSR